MSSFAAEVVRLKNVRHHPKADRLDLVDIKGFTCVTMRDRFIGGDLAIYVPEAAVVPDELLRPGFWKTCEACAGVGTDLVASTMSLSSGTAAFDGPKCPDCKGRGGTGMLAGSKGNRVKAVRLRGELSQGILFSRADIEPHFPGATDEFGEDCWTVGHDFGKALNITKYEPPIPRQLAGEVYAADGITGYTEIENVKNFPDVLVDGEEVVMVEKLHGSCLVAHFDGERVHVTSKGLGSKGLALEDARDAQGNRTNFYWRCLEAVGGEAALRALSVEAGGASVTLYGEALPCQDLKYGVDPNKPTMRAFDLKINGQYVDFDHMVEDLRHHKVPMAPALYRGPYSQEVLEQRTSGKTVAGDKQHIREGVVVRPTRERRDDRLGRVILKSISPDYLTRKNGSEFT